MTFPPKFVWSWPSWVVESFGGLLAFGLVLLAAWMLSHWWGLFVVATILSFFYEARLDANGWDLDDVLQRQVVITAAALGWIAFR